MNSRLVYLLFGVIVVVGILLRFVWLGSVPNGLQQDETSIGYNAFSILQTGKDEYGKTYPLYFKAFGEYKLPLSVYLTSLSFLIFGVSEFSLRLPSALFGSLTIIFVFFLAKELFKKDSIALVAIGLMAINPWHLHFSRGAYEVTPALFFIVLGLYLFLLFLRKQSVVFLSLSLLTLGVSMYGYNIARLFIPLFVILLFAIAYRNVRNIPKRNLIFPILGMVFIIHTFFLSFGSGGYESTKGTLIPTSAYVQAANLENRSYFLEHSIIAKSIFNKPISDALYYFKNVVSYLNVDFLFLKGSSHGNHGIGSVGQFYIFEIVTIILGMVWLAKKLEKRGILLFAWIIIVILVASLTREAPQATRSFFMLVPLTILSSFGVTFTFKSIKKLKNKMYVLSSLLLVFVGLFFIVHYLTTYFIKFPVQYAKNFRSEDKVIASQLKEKYQDYDVIYIDKNADVLYTSLLFYTQFDPRVFQKTARRAQDDSEGFSKVISFGKYEYIDLENTQLQDHSMIVTNREISGYKTVAKFTYPIRPVVIPKGQEIISFPVTDVAYVLLEKN